MNNITKTMMNKIQENGVKFVIYDLIVIESLFN